MRTLATDRLILAPLVAAHADAMFAVLSDPAIYAYEFGSAWWGQGCAREATQAMIDDLVAQHGARELAAVLKSANFRSVRLLERLGFAPASPEAHVLAQVEPDERLMVRDRSQDASMKSRRNITSAMLAVQADLLPPCIGAT